MIKHVIFDMGGVLVDFNPKRSLKKHFTDKEDLELLFKEIFEGPDWVKLDRGTLTVEQAVDRACERLPARFHACVRCLLNTWADELLPMDDMLPLVQEVKNKGYGIYLLSNAPLNFHTYRDKIPAFTYFDGFIISAEHLTLKPEPEIYRVLFDTFNLSPTECFFIDDIPVNIEGAAAVGMKGHCFDHGDVAVLRAALKEEGIL